MEEALELARAKDTKERMAGVERLHEVLEASRKSLSSSEVTALVDCCLDLLKDNNFKVSQGALQSLDSAAVLSGDHLKLHFNALVPAVVDRLGDAKQPVRDAARRLLLTLMQVSSPTIIVERAGSYAWTHKSWRVREEFARTVTSAIGLFAATELPLQRAILPPILQMLSDSNLGVREAAILCIELQIDIISGATTREMYTQAGPQFRDELQRHHLPASMVKDINARLERIEPHIRPADGLTGNFATVEIKSATLNPKRSSPKARSSSRETSLFGGEGDITEKPIEPIKVYSEKELIREVEKIASTLVPEKDWSIRITVMQKVEGLVSGGAADYPCFRGLLKQLVGPLSTQLSDRRSSIVKQACHLLCFLSKELLGDFEGCAEMFIPVLFKLVVITVLVIAESADNCIKTMLRNCKVARILPRMADCAKNDRNAILRARCCEYALLILEHWPDAPEIQRSADLYEDFIKCCVADAMSEVRSTARMCYRMFAKTWPERSRRLFSSFDPVIQRIINEEDGGIHRRHASPSIRDRGALTSLTSQSSAPSNLPGYGTSAIVAMDRSSSLQSGTSLSSGLLLSQAKSLSKGGERSLESVLHASKQKVTAIESMLRGLELSDKHNSTLRSSSLDLGVDPPSSRDPPFPPAVPASNYLSNSLMSETTASSISKGSNRNGGLVLSDIITQIQASKDSGKLSSRSNVATEPLPSFSSYSAKRISEESHDMREARRFMNPNIERQYVDTPYKDGNFRESHTSHVPNFQRPLLRKHVAGRMSAGRRKSFDDSQLSLGEMSNYVDGPASLSDALSEGLSTSSDWSARVAAFNYLHSLLQQGPKGIQEVIQNFEKVMKLFFQHLDDPHHKVAQAALSTLADIIPSCRKPFESYMERILPHVFSRLIDPKELVRQPCATTLEIVSKTYSTDSLLPALLRSLDEQRSPKAKLAVIDFAISSFNKHAMNSEGYANSGILKLWLAKLTPLAHDKNTKLKEAAITCIISVYSHFDSTAVLNFILSLSVEEQNSLRRALKQFTPRIEVDLMNFLQNKKERQRPKSSYDPSDMVPYIERHKALKGIQEVIQNFEKVMKLFFQHLDDPHHKVAQAALSTLADIIPSCRKPFESYMERILPHVFSRLIDPKELVRQPCATTLEIVSKTYSTDSLLPALLRSLDEQRSPKAKLAVIDFAISSFNKHAMNSEGYANSGILKLWLAKLTPLAHDKNTKLKEAAITCIISVYSHFDSTAVLNFILSLSVEEQNSLRRALKQFTPRIEVDLMNFLQNKKERQRPKSSYDPSDMVGTSSEEGYIGASKKSNFYGRYSAGSIDSDSGRKWSSTGNLGQAVSDETQENLYQGFDISSNADGLGSKTKDLSYTVNPTGQNLGSWSSQQENVDSNVNLEGLSTRMDINGLLRSDHLEVAEVLDHANEAPTELDLNHYKPKPVNVTAMPDTGPSIPQILHLISNGNNESPTSSKRGALQQLIEASLANDQSIWTKYFNQILTVVLEVLDDSDSSIRELALALVIEMLKNQKDAMEDSVEIVIEKLLHVTKDIVPKVSNEGEHCLTIVLSQYDPFRCLSVIVPLLVTEDEKTLVTCINCLTKLVGRLSQEELMAQLPSFLPALFEAFGNPSADVRKTVVFCLVDIYIMLGKAFLPYLEGLNSTQLRLVTIYANRISQARTGTAVDANHD
ncbi:CLIP-associated protein [Morella rubra]|uniref:CLIP-associated protein n=1 Tax=Morella rubra TaxID=262757 RepID=A0A6A1V7P8_9ROSI|nr:CLIP-associated protein [Morella rubra]